jgi:hypothetical protein
MFNPVFDSVQTSQLILNRIARIANQLRSFVAYTQVDYQAEVYSQVNGVLNLGNKMTPPAFFAGQTPAIVGDITTYLGNLNNDGNDIAAEVTSIETQIAQYYNLSAGVQNTLRQKVREQVYGSIASQYIEAFVNDAQMQPGYTANLDFNAGVATCPLTSDTTVNPNTIITGPSSISSTATANANYDPMQLLNPTHSVTNVVVWNGSQLELQLQFSTPTPLNRLIIHQDNYEGLEIISLTSSPDGIYFDKIDAELFPDDLTLDAKSGKYSGDAIIDFNPRTVSVMKIVIADLIGQGFVALRGIETHQRVFASSGQFTSKPIYTPTGLVNFATVQRIYNQLTQITHQLSYDGVHFSVIQPGQSISLVSSPFWYRAQLDVVTAAFSSAASPLAQGNGDPGISPNYTLGNITSTNLNGGVLQRNIVFTSVTGPIVLNETPIPNTLAVYYGSTLQPASAYVFTNNTLTLASLPQSNVTVRYQTSTFGTAGLASLQNNFTPYLFQASFEQA